MRDKVLKAAQVHQQDSVLLHHDYDCRTDEETENRFAILWTRTTGLEERREHSGAWMHGMGMCGEKRATGRLFVCDFLLSFFALFRPTICWRVIRELFSAARMQRYNRLYKSKKFRLQSPSLRISRQKA